MALHRITALLNDQSAAAPWLTRALLQGRHRRLIASGLALALAAALCGLANLALTIFGIPTGPAPTILFLLFLGAIQLASGGIIAEYLGTLDQERLGV